MNKNIKYILVLIVLGYFLFFFGNNLFSLTNPDEVFYTQTAKEMLKSNSWMTPILFDHPQFEKPIFIYWLLKIAFLTFGVSSFSARFFPACFALFGIVAVYLFAKLLFKEEKKAFISALLLLSSCFYIGLARTVFTDMVFSVMILFSLLSFYWGYKDERRKGLGIMLFFIFSALAILTKGPLGLIIPFLIVVVFLLAVGRSKFIFSKYTLWGIGALLAIALPWYIFMASKYGQNFLHEFFYNDHYRRIIEAEHRSNDTWHFYPLTMLGGMFPWSIFSAVAFFLLLRRLKKANSNNLFLLSWIAVTFLIFQIAHSKLSSYIFPFFPALALLTGDYIFNLCNASQNKFACMPFILTSCILFLLSIALPFGLVAYPQYAAVKTPLYFLIFLFVYLFLVMLRFILRRELFKVTYLT
ncbi:MAG: glycosyltransferase family 39 protein, partial [Candidatus Omnitrophica bacterium]|nr:glycosyltransferase family 39 protein [Candidatus Omnitrophota bacterium]